MLWKYEAGGGRYWSRHERVLAILARAPPDASFQIFFATSVSAGGRGRHGTLDGVRSTDEASVVLRRIATKLGLAESAVTQLRLLRAGKQLEATAPCGLAKGDTVHVVGRLVGGDARGGGTSEKSRAEELRQWRGNRTEEQKRAARERASELRSVKRGNRTEEQKRAARKRATELERARREAAYEAQRRAVRDADRAARGEARGAMSDEQRFAERQKDAAARRKDRQEIQRDKVAACMRKARGVVAEYTAIHAPNDTARTQCLLLDVFETGSSFLTVNARRLVTLVEGSDEYERCVPNVSEDIARYCHVGITDHARMIRNYAKCKREAAELTVCPCCGRRDLKKYSPPIRLRNTPIDHWSRLDPCAFQRLRNAPDIVLMKRGTDGTFNERTLDGSDNQSRVRVPRVEFHSIFEFEGAQFHMIEEAIEYDESGEPLIRLCESCDRAWSKKRPRGEAAWKPTESARDGDAHERRHGYHDDIYWQVSGCSVAPCKTRTRRGCARQADCHLDSPLAGGPIGYHRTWRGLWPAAASQEGVRDRR